ncbi:hypothetical protein ACGLHS_31695 [Variovorax sp. VaC1]|uniref:hypothetical protein n=1 Tax=Burkholderiales TaxID=80840 RepID=UPI0037494E22
MNPADICEWAGSLLGIAGALLLALNLKISRYGWFVFLAANVAMIAFAILIDRRGLLLQQVTFTGTSLIGIHRAGFKFKLQHRQH